MNDKDVSDDKRTKQRGSRIIMSHQTVGQYSSSAYVTIPLYTIAINVLEKLAHS